MENPSNFNNSLSSMNSICNAFGNLSFQSNNDDENNNRVGTISNLSTFAINPNPPTTTTTTTTTTHRATVALSQPPPGFESPQRASNLVAAEFRDAAPRNYRSGIEADYTNMGFPLSSSLDFFGIVSCKYGLVKFNRMLNMCNEDQLCLIALKATSQHSVFLELSANPHGSTALRKLLKRTGQVDDIVLTAVLQVFVPLMTSQYGHYVVIETLRSVKREKQRLLCQVAEQHTLDLAQDQTGCISLNKFITDATSPYKDRILDLIASNALWLSQDPSGNFVVQHVLELQNPFVADKIGLLLYGHFVQISMQKQGSYVVEKCLNSAAIAYVVDELMKSRELVRLAKNEFGNYVMQCALKVTRKGSIELYEQLAAKLRPHFGALQKGFGRNIVNLIDKLAENDRKNHWFDL